MPGVEKTDTGTLTWVYELDLYRNPTMLFTVLKAMLASCIVIGVILGVLLSGGSLLDRVGVPAFIGYVLLATLGFLALTVAIYYLVAFMKHGKHRIAYEMDDSGITYRPVRPTASEMGTRGVLADLAEIALSNSTTNAINANAPTRIRFDKAKKITAKPQRDEIYVRTRIVGHKVFVPRGDFDSVLEHIRRYAPQAR